MGAVPHVATMELSAAGARAVAIAATGAIAIFGSVAIQGAHGDLLKGLENAATDMNASTDVWVSPAGSYNLLNTTPFAPVDRARLERLAGRAGGAPVSQRAAGLRPAARAGDRPARPGRRRCCPLPSSCRATCARRANACAPAAGWSSLRRSPPNTIYASARRSRCRRPYPSTLARRGAVDEHRLGARCDRHERRPTTRARGAATDASAYSILLDPGVPPARAVREIQTRARAALGAGRAERRTAHPPPERAQPRSARRA